MIKKLKTSVVYISWLEYRSFNKTQKSFNKNYNWEYDILEPGYKYNMNNLVASLGIAQLNKLKWLNLQEKN